MIRGGGLFESNDDSVRHGGVCFVSREMFWKRCEEILLKVVTTVVVGGDFYVCLFFAIGFGLFTGFGLWLCNNFF